MTSPYTAQPPLLAVGHVLNGVMQISLDFPPASLSGHNTGHWRGKSNIVSAYRDAAREATKRLKLKIPATGDIKVQVDFMPPDNRGDRINFPNRMKPYFDGIADGLGVNDKRFIPTYIFHSAGKPGVVLVTIGEFSA